MKHIEIKSEGYTYRYEFEPVPSTVATLLCTSLSACGGALQMSNKKWRSSKLNMPLYAKSTKNLYGGVIKRVF